ncbi:hypothetical protein RND81_08G131800 [Saponaria officinalis]|uniref:Pentatricopeptide repeat-containing protein n=1 Tax=Saponaria officinalis TaxID=3572 RepID=A0AAW1JAE7_SAPOF
MNSCDCNIGLQRVCRMPPIFYGRSMQFHRLNFNHLSRIPSFVISSNSTYKIHTNTTITSEIPKNNKCCNNVDGFTLVQMIRTCTKNGYVLQGEQLHCHALRRGFDSDVYFSTSLVSFYAKVVCVDIAGKVFDEMSERNVVSWNAMISGYVHSGKLVNALSFFTELNRSEIRPDAYSFTSVLAACGQLSLLLFGMSIHSKVIVYGLDSSVVVVNCLIDMYGKSNLVGGSIGVFDGLLDKDAISWNSVIAACARNQRLDLAFDYFYQMPYPDTVTYNELITGVSRFGVIDDAVTILWSMPKSNSSSWNSILSAYVVRNRAGEALEFFVEMHRKGVVMDEFTFSSIISGIASISALLWGKLMHCYTIKCGLMASTIVGSALIDMYSKCGKVEDAETLFHGLSQKNIVTWNALISGFAHNGESLKVVKYFEKLKETKGLRPDDVTFVNVLASCCHNQMPLEKAYEYFRSMINDHEIKPRPEHVTSVIKLMGHHRQLSKVEAMIDYLGLGSCAAVWRALLGACGNYAELEIAKVAAVRLSELEGHNEFGYVTLSNINKVCENWGDATAVWGLMKDRGVTKGAGFSWIDGR